MFENLSQWVLEAIEIFGYAGLALLPLIENLFPPMPSEVALPLAGFLVGWGELGFLGALVASTLGALIGAFILYSLGWWGGRGLVLRHGGKLRVSAEDLDRAEGWFARYADAVVLGARVVPFARSVGSIPAGTSRMQDAAGEVRRAHCARLCRVERRSHRGRLRCRRHLGPGERLGGRLLRCRVGAVRLWPPPT